MRRLLTGLVVGLVTLSADCAFAGVGFGDGEDSGGHSVEAPEGPAGGTVEEGVINVYAADMTIRTDHVSSGSVRASGPACEYRVNDITSY